MLKVLKIYTLLAQAIIVGFTGYLLLERFIIYQSPGDEEMLSVVIPILALGIPTIIFSIKTFRLLQYFQGNQGNLRLSDIEQIAKIPLPLWVCNYLFGIIMLIIGSFLSYLTLTENMREILIPLLICFLIVSCGTFTILNAILMKRKIKKMKLITSEELFADFGKKVEQKNEE